MDGRRRICPVHTVTVWKSMDQYKRCATRTQRQFHQKLLEFYLISEQKAIALESNERKIQPWWVNKVKYQKDLIVVLHSHDRKEKPTNVIDHWLREQRAKNREVSDDDDRVFNNSRTWVYALRIPSLTNNCPFTIRLDL